MIKILENDNKFLIAFFAFGILGVLSNPIFLGILAYILIIIALIDVFKNSNQDGQAHLYMGMFGSLELLLRMSKAISPHEISKYIIIIFSILGLFFTKKRRKSNAFGLLFILVLLPSLVQVSITKELWLESIVSNVLGPISLGVFLIYFYRYEINKIDIRNLIRAIILPLFSVLVFIQNNTITFDEISEVDFTASNLSLSGNFGPNQVSVIFGIGFALLLYSIFFGIKIFKYRLLDIAFLIIFAFRGFLTFSRGGISVPFVAFALVVLLSFVRIRDIKAFRRGISLVIGGVIFYLVFLLANVITGSALEKRFAGETGVTEKTGERDLLSGRDQIVMIDLQIFSDNMLLGVGPGMAKPLRYYCGFANAVAAHTEFSRLLAEHGLLGAIAILLYTYIIINRRKYWKTFQNETFFLLFTWWIGFLNSNHNALRLGLTILFLGLIVGRTRINPKYFTKSAKNEYPDDWDAYLEENAKAQEPNSAASEPSKKLEQMATLPR